MAKIFEVGFEAVRTKRNRWTILRTESRGGSSGHRRRLGVACGGHVAQWIYVEALQAAIWL